MDPARAPPGSGSPGELHVSFVLGLTGAVAGLVYLDDRRPGAPAEARIRYRADVARILMAKAENRPANV